MSEIIAEAIAEKRVLQQLIDTYTPFVNEAKLHFGDDGIHVRTVDPANACMAITDLDKAAFESYDSPGSATVGVNLDRIDERLSVGSTDDIVYLSLDMETRKLNVEVGRIDQTVALIDPDSVRQEPDLPELDLPNRFAIEARELSEIQTATEMVSDHFEIQGNPKRETVTFYAKGDIDETTITFDKDDLTRFDVTDAAKSRLSLAYFGELVKPMPPDAEVFVTFGNEFPILMEWVASEGDQETTSFLAPRIASDW